LNDYLLSILLGIVEGLTEFLPVSSTAHLRIAEVLLNVPLSSGYWKMYSIVIQLGAILVLPIYFRQHIAKLISTFPEGERKDCDYLTHPLSLVMIAFVVTAIPSFSADQSDRKESRESLRDGRIAVDRRHRHVGHRRHESALGKSGAGRVRLPDSHLENGRHPRRPSHLDRRLPDSFRRFPPEPRAPCQR